MPGKVETVLVKEVWHIDLNILANSSLSSILPWLPWWRWTHPQYEHRFPLQTWPQPQLRAPQGAAGWPSSPAAAGRCLRWTAISTAALLRFIWPITAPHQQGLWDRKRRRLRRQLLSMLPRKRHTSIQPTCVFSKRFAWLPLCPNLQEPWSVGPVTSCFRFGERLSTNCWRWCWLPPWGLPSPNALSSCFG